MIASFLSGTVSSGPMNNFFVNEASADRIMFGVTDMLYIKIERQHPETNFHYVIDMTMRHFPKKEVRIDIDRVSIKPKIPCTLKN